MAASKYWTLLLNLNLDIASWSECFPLVKKQLHKRTLGMVEDDGLQVVDLHEVKNKMIQKLRWYICLQVVDLYEVKNNLVSQIGTRIFDTSLHKS